MRAPVSEFWIKQTSHYNNDAIGREGESGGENPYALCTRPSPEADFANRNNNNVNEIGYR